MATPQEKRVHLDELSVGEHVYRKKPLLGLEVLGDALCHHAIVQKIDKGAPNKGNVIGFGRRPSKPLPTGPTEGNCLPTQRKVIVETVAQLVKLFFDTMIKTEPLSDFLNDDGTVFVYEYGVPDSDNIHYMHGQSSAEKRHDQDAAGIAAAFTKALSERPFGDYSLSKWNCECFASFCKTTTMSLEVVEALVSDLNGGEYVDQKLLKECSEAKTLQIERLIKNGFKPKKGKESIPLERLDDEDLELEHPSLV